MKCHICNQEFNNARSHIYLFHRFKIKDYYDKYLKKPNEGKCLYCDSLTTFRSIDLGYRKSCSKHAFNLTKKIIKDKYGVDNISKLEYIKEQKRQTTKEHFGKEYSFQVSECREKTKNTLIEKYGVDNVSKSPIIMGKIRTSMREKCGFEHALQSPDSMIKFKKTCIKNHGVDNPLKNKELHKKQIKSLQANFGVDYPLQSPELFEKIKNSIIEKYGVDNYSKTFEFRKLAREMLIRDIESKLKDGEKFSPRKGIQEIPFIQELRKHTSYFIDNDFQIISYFPDGYIKELNLVIEFDEHWHKRPFQRNKDIIKDQDYQKIGLSVFRISQKYWEENKEKVIQEFKQRITT